MAVLLGRVTGVAVVLAAVAASGAEVTRLVKARVMITGAAATFQHEVAIFNKGESRRVVSVLLWNRNGLLKPPKNLVPPDGWDVQVLQRESLSGSWWSVRFECRVVPSKAAASGTGAEEAVDEEVPCGIKAGETVRFNVVLPYPSDTLEGQPILVGFSDGRIGIAS